jgi:putative transposase
MRKSRFTEEQIALALRQAEGGTPVAEICRKLQVTETTFYRWKKKYGGLGVSELRELRQLREENRQLKQVVADLTLDKHILNEGAKKKDGERLSGARCGGVGAYGVPAIGASGVPCARCVALDGAVPERSGSG